LSKLTHVATVNKSAFSTARGRDDCGKTLSQHLSFGATIRALPGGNLSADFGAKTRLGLGTKS